MLLVKKNRFMLLLQMNLSGYQNSSQLTRRFPWFYTIKLFASIFYPRILVVGFTKKIIGWNFFFFSFKHFKLTFGNFKFSTW